MFVSTSTFAAVLSLFAMASSAAPLQGFKVKGPSSLSECSMAKFSWENAVSPVYITVIEQGVSFEEASADRVNVRLGDRVAWKVDLPRDTTVSFALEDSTGNIQFIPSMTVRAGSTHCFVDDEEEDVVPTTTVYDAADDVTNALFVQTS